MESEVRTTRKCALEGCGGESQQITNLYLHTLGGDLRKADFGEFVECNVWRCTKCGHTQLFTSGEHIRAR